MSQYEEDDFQHEDGPRPTQSHSLSELLRDSGPETMGERFALFAKEKLPIIIGVALPFLIVIIFVLPNVILSDEQKAAAKASGVETKMRTDVEEVKIEEKKDEDEKIERTAIPEFDATNVTDVVQDDFTTTTDDQVNPYAQSTERFGMAEGDENAQDNLFTMSTGGKGLAGAIGVGSGSGAGGGMRKGSPMGGARIARKNQQKASLEQTEKVVMAGLDWLKRHQSPDGSWDPVGFDGLCEGGKCSGRGSSIHTAGVTGLALLTYLGAGYDSQRPSPYLESIKKGLKWLKNNQDAEGCFGSRSNNRFTYSHACATLAMCEAYSSHRLASWKQAAQAGIKFIGTCQNPYKAWRYGVKPGDNDTSVTGWMLMALKSGADVGLEVDMRSLQDGVAFVNSMTDEETGRTGYVKRGDPPVRPEGLTEKWPASESEALTAVAMCSRIFAKTAEQDAALMTAGANLLSKKLPVWDEAGGKIDMYYWYYGTLAMFQIGGTQWEAWNKALKNVVIDQQVKDGCQRGSWEPKDPWCEDGGRIYATCLMTLCLEVYYRYPRVFGTKGGDKK